MTYRVILLSEAERSLNDNADWWAENRDPDEARVWLLGFREALATLKTHPYRCPFARENEAVSFELRQLLFGVSAKICLSNVRLLCGLWLPVSLFRRTHPVL